MNKLKSMTSSSNESLAHIYTRSTSHLIQLNSSCRGCTVQSAWDRNYTAHSCALFQQKIKLTFIISANMILFLEWTNCTCVRCTETCIKLLTYIHLRLVSHFNIIRLYLTLDENITSHRRILIFLRSRIRDYRENVGITDPRKKSCR